MKKILGLWALLLLLAAGALAEPVRLYCLNIGKADCMLLLCEDQAFLVDSGYEHTYPALKTMLSACGVTHLDGVFLTHCHEDHYGGLLPLAESSVKIEAFYAPRFYDDVKTDEHPAQMAAEMRGQDVLFLDAGDRIPAGRDSFFTVLGPLRINEENENNNSLVMQFTSPEGSILFTGDMKFDEEADLLAEGCFSPCTLLKAGHHGDDKATSTALLEAVRPQAAVILTSTEEEADTPAPETLERLADAGCAVYCSQDAQDALLFTLEGGRVQAEDIAWPGIPRPAEGCTLEIDPRDQRIVITNGGSSPLNLAGCTLYLSKGDSMLALPHVQLAPGEPFIVGSLASETSCDLIWHQKSLFSKRKENLAVLTDPFGRALARDTLKPGA